MGTLLHFPSRPIRPASATNAHPSGDAVLVKAMAVVDRYRLLGGTMRRDQLLDELLDILDGPAAFMVYLSWKDEPLG